MFARKLVNLSTAGKISYGILKNFFYTSSETKVRDPCNRLTPGYMNTFPQPHAKKVGNKATCTMIPGDGVGPELVFAVQEIFRAAGVPIDFEIKILSEMKPQDTLEDAEMSIKRNRICLKSTLFSPSFHESDDLMTTNIRFRNDLDLFANVAYIKSLPGLTSRHKNLDILVVREQIEGEYSHLEHEIVKGVVEYMKVITRHRSRRIAKFAFDMAKKLGRKKVTAVHKANIMKLADGLFLKSCKEISLLYPEIEFQDMIVDNCTMQMVSYPHQFDVMVAPNLYGLILDNIGAGLVGGAGIVAGASYSEHHAIFEPGSRHIFQETKGQLVANPTAMILCSALLLDHVNLKVYAKAIRGAVTAAIQSGCKTKDVGGDASTREFTQAVICSLEYTVDNYEESSQDEWMKSIKNLTPADDERADSPEPQPKSDSKPRVC